MVPAGSMLGEMRPHSHNLPPPNIEKEVVGACTIHCAGRFSAPAHTRSFAHILADLSTRPSKSLVPSLLLTPITLTVRERRRVHGDGGRLQTLQEAGHLLLQSRRRVGPSDHALRLGQLSGATGVCGCVWVWVWVWVFVCVSKWRCILCVVCVSCFVSCFVCCVTCCISRASPLMPFNSPPSPPTPPSPLHLPGLPSLPQKPR